jgi:hypothetical protein
VDEGGVPIVRQLLWPEVRSPPTSPLSSFYSLRFPSCCFGLVKQQHGGDTGSNEAGGGDGLQPNGPAAVLRDRRLNRGAYPRLLPHAKACRSQPGLAATRERGRQAVRRQVRSFSVHSSLFVFGNL